MMAVTNYGSLDKKCGPLKEFNQRRVTIRHSLSKDVLIVPLKKTSIRLSLLLVIYISLMAGSAAIFSYLESPTDSVLQTKVDSAIQGFLSNHPTVPKDELFVFIQDIVTMANNGLSIGTNGTTEQSKWTFSESLFFSSTVVTTIGYGHITPISQKGKLFCMLVASIGIPMTLTLLGAFTDRMLIPAISLLEYLRRKLGNSLGPLSIRVVHLTIIALIMFVLAMFIPAIILTTVEPTWGWMDSFYFCFISLTTIGLGDYVPGDVPDKYKAYYKCAIMVYLYIGMAVVMTALAVFYDIPELNLTMLFKRQKLSEETVGLVQNNGSSPVRNPRHGIAVNLAV